MPQQYDPNEQVTLSFTAPAAVWNGFVAHWTDIPYKFSALFLSQFAQQTQGQGPQPDGLDGGGAYAEQRHEARVTAASSPRSE